MCPFTQNSIWQIVEAQAQQGKDTHSIFDIIGKEIQAKIVEHDRCLAFHDFPLQSGRASVSFLKMEGKKAFSSILYNLLKEMSILYILVLYILTYLLV
uniref:Uncharacterized protein n=2 Tax=Sus scrofa TaxID=9823 RepID=A0A8D1BCA1_PIG